MFDDADEITYSEEPMHDETPEPADHQTVATDMNYETDLERFTEGSVKAVGEAIQQGTDAEHGLLEDEPLLDLDEFPADEH